MAINELAHVVLSESEETLLASCLGISALGFNSNDDYPTTATLWLPDSSLLIQPIEEGSLHIPEHPAAHISRIAVETRDAHLHPMNEDLGLITEITIFRAVVDFQPLQRRERVRVLDLELKNVLYQEFRFVRPGDARDLQGNFVALDVGIMIRTNAHFVCALTGPGVTIKYLDVEDGVVRLVSDFQVGSFAVVAALDDDQLFATLMEVGTPRSLAP